MMCTGNKDISDVPVLMRENAENIQASTIPLKVIRQKSFGSCDNDKITNLRKH